MPGGADDGTTLNQENVIKVPPGMVKKIAAAKASDKACGIAGIPVTNEVAKKLEDGNLVI